MADVYDLIIIGAGPAGQSAAIYAARARLCTLWIDSSFIQGGQIADSALVDNYPGLPGRSGQELGELLAEHAKKLGMEPVREKVLSVAETQEGEAGFSGRCKIIRTKKNEYLAKTLIYAAGASHRKLQIPGEEKFSGMGVSYCATCDGAFYKEMNVAVVGGGNTACEEALFLSRLCRKVYLLHRRASLRADNILQELVMNTENIEILWNTRPQEIVGEDAVKGIRISKGLPEAAEETFLPAEGVFIAVGMEPNSGLLKSLVKLDEAGYIAAGEDCASSAEGIFAAGDVRTKQLRQVVTAVSDGANAVASVCRLLRTVRGRMRFQSV
ncbi:MAG: FAD-dependent oxidoreductase [Blautia sp.]|nr:FAD-dependent oxidoreductase [Blautia sp.]